MNEPITMLPPLPQLKLDQVLTGGNLTLILLLVAAVGVIVGLVFAYHWNNYGLRPSRAFLAETVYFAGLFLLVAAGFTIITLL